MASTTPDDAYITRVSTVDPIRAATDITYALSFGKSPGFVAYDPSFHTIIGAHASLRKIAVRDFQFAHEAGVYVKRTNAVYFTANFQTCDPISLFSVNCTTHEIQQHEFKDVVMANGACHYQDSILYCSQGNMTVPSALVLVDPVTEESKVLINNFHGRQFSSINDVVVNHDTGDIWFTDPTYGYHQAFRPLPELPAQVYRFSPLTGECWAVADGFEMCNGLCFSPDYKILYVTDTAAVGAHDGPGDGHNMKHDKHKPATIYAFEVSPEGTAVYNRRLFAYCANGIPDGIKCDAKGNVYSGCGDGIHVWNPFGTLVGKIATGDVVANFCFTKGGIWILAEKELYFAEIDTQGTLVSIECE
ncbi:putative lactonohydrolase [Limtongia smithiae]|uniref:putative lactonohydrolase n=1 Tax=Limtongia smithiae TaxID=1125753 RepID=UPI0034CE405F